MSRSRFTRPAQVAATAGFSTLNALISLTLLGLVLVPIVGTVVRGQRSFITSWDHARASGSARYAHLSLSRLVRMAGSDPLGSPTAGVDPDPRGDGVFDDIRLRADYNPADGDVADPGEDLTFYVRGDTLIVVAGGDPDAEEPYVLGVDSLAFEYYDRDGVLMTDPDRIRRRAVSARITLRARGESRAGDVSRLLEARVRLRNGK